MRLSDVAVDYHAPTGRLWHLTANEARVPPGGSTVEFEGDVRLAGRPGEDPGAAELHTARLALDTVTEVADTRAPVELAFGAHRMRALGMRADLKSGTCAWNPTSMATSHRSLLAVALLAACAAAARAGARAAADPAQGELAGLDCQKGVLEVSAR